MSHGGGNNGNGGGNRRSSGGVPSRHHSFDSNGPEIRIRGTAWQVFEKYQALARDAQTAGDRVRAENLLQHAEHYYRIILEIQEATGENQMQQRPRTQGQSADGRPEGGSDSTQEGGLEGSYDHAQDGNEQDRDSRRNYDGGSAEVVAPLHMNPSVDPAHMPQPDLDDGARATDTASGAPRAQVA